MSMVLAVALNNAVYVRYYLALGMIASGVSTFLFGLAYNTGIHNLWYFLAVQVVTGMFQVTLALH